MNRITIAGIAFLLWCGCAFAQEEFRKPKQTGYFFVAPGAMTINVNSRPSIEIGAGYEGFLYKGFGVGIDGGAIRLVSQGSSGNWTGIATLNGIYDFQRAEKQKLCPFVAAGFTTVPESDVGGGYNFGGGIKYWFAERAGVRLDFRFHARPGHLRTYDDIQVRIGIALR